MSKSSSATTSGRSRARASRVLLVEDVATHAQRAAAILRTAGITVVERHVGSVDGFERALLEETPDAVVCAHTAVGVDAVRALARLKTLRPEIPFIVVTDSPEDPSLVDCIKAGADDVVLATDLDRLTVVLREALAVREGLEALSPRQLEVLCLVVEGYTTRGVAEHLGVSHKTAESHRIEMMKRLGIHDVVRLVRYATRVKLIVP